MSEELVQQMRVVEHNLQHIIIQKQTLQSELHEINMAVTNLEETSDAYVTVGNLMIKRPSESIKKELEQKQKNMQIRIDTLTKQEEKLHEKKQEVQNQIVKELGDTHD